MSHANSLLIQDFRDFSCSLSQGSEDHRHGSNQEARRHRRHVHPLPYYSHSYGPPKRFTSFDQTKMKVADGPRML